MEVQLLGSPRVQFEGQCIELPHSKPMLLVYYLALEATWISREELAFFFRPDATEAVARHYIRKMLSEVRQFPWAGDLEVERNRLRWQVDSDVKRFSEAVHKGRYSDAMSLYNGLFLSDLRVDSSPSFEAWLEYRREELAMLWHDACINHAAELESAGNHRKAANIAKKLLEHDSLAEDALQAYIRNTYQMGKRDLALRAAATFQRELKHEVDLEPLIKTQHLIDAVKRSEPIDRVQDQSNYGRRSTDRPPLASNDHKITELLELLQNPQIRLLDISDALDSGSLLLSHRIPDLSAALYAIVNLSAWLISQQHHQRAGELLSLVLNHRLCDGKILAHANYTKGCLDKCVLGESRVEQSLSFEGLS